MTTEELMQVWGAEHLGVPAGTAVRFYDGSESSGGCETCGYGGDEAYYLEVSASVNGKYVSKDYRESFMGLIRALDAIAQRSDRETP